MRFASVPALLAIASSIACAASIVAQAPTAAPSSVGVASADSALLKKEFDDVAKYLAKKGGIGADDRVTLQKLLARVQPLAASGDPTALAMQVQLATWLEDETLLDASYEGLLALNPKNESALSQWVAVLSKRCQYQRAITEANARFTNLTEAPRLAITLIETLIAANRFEDAKLLADSMTQLAATRPDVAQRLNPVRQRLELLMPQWAAEEALRLAENSKDDLPRVELVTSKGSVLIELFEDQAPNSTAAFLGFVESGLYNSTRFHKRVSGVGVLGGDPNSKPGATGRIGMGSPGYRLPDESKRSDRRGAFGATLGFAKAATPATPPKPNEPVPPRTVDNSAGSDFFVLYAPSEFLQDEFTMFGRVLDGFEVIAQLGPTDEIVAARVLRKRSHEYKVAQSPELPTPMELTVLTPAPPRSSVVDMTRGGNPFPNGAPNIPMQPRAAPPQR